MYMQIILNIYIVFVVNVLFLFYNIFQLHEELTEWVKERLKSDRGETLWDPNTQVRKYKLHKKTFTHEKRKEKH